METTLVAENHIRYDQEYDSILSQLQNNMSTVLAGGAQLFLTDVDTTGLWTYFLAAISNYGGEEMSQYFNCSNCRDTVRKFGGVVTIGEDGSLIPLMWLSTTEDTPLHRANRAAHSLVIKAKVVSLFVNDKTDMGVHSTIGKCGHEWTHYHFQLPAQFVYGTKATLTSNKAESASQKMALSKERFRILMNGDTGIHQYSLEVYRTAMMLLENKELNRSDHFFASAQFHFRVKDSIKNNTLPRSLLWRELMSKPNGWENVNSTMIGTLYEWIGRGTPLDQIKRMWNERVKGENFQRPKEAPSEAAIAQAEALVEKMGIAPAFQRRYARFEEVRCFWTPPQLQREEPKTGGLFSSVVSKEAQKSTPVNYITSTKPITWEKFAETVLPTAEKIELKVPFHGNFVSFVTAVNTDAPPIIQWDQEDDRYPVSTYLYTGGSNSRQWGLAPDVFTTVKGVADLPGFEKRFAFLLENCKDSNTQAGSALFPEVLKSELHGIRSVVEAYSNKNHLSGHEEASAAGYQIQHNACGVTVRVTTGSEMKIYLIDRMD